MAEDTEESPAPENFNFEEAIKELERIADRMERGEQSLEQAMRDFEDGMRLSKLCRKNLDEAQMRIDKLIAKNGQESLQPMDMDGNEKLPGAAERDGDDGPF